MNFVQVLTEMSIPTDKGDFSLKGKCRLIFCIRRQKNRGEIWEIYKIPIANRRASFCLFSLSTLSWFRPGCERKLLMCRRKSLPSFSISLSIFVFFFSFVVFFFFQIKAAIHFNFIFVFFCVSAMIYVHCLAHLRTLRLDWESIQIQFDFPLDNSRREIRKKKEKMAEPIECSRKLVDYRQVATSTSR